MASLGRARLDWKGPQVRAAVRQNVAASWSEFGLRVETAAKQQLYKGHGVRSGTLRRSIHVAPPGYAWHDDNVTPADGTPERGGQAALPGMEQDGLHLEVGSGMVYALAIHQGFEKGSFAGYHYLTNALALVKPELPEILRRHGAELKR